MPSLVSRLLVGALVVVPIGATAQLRTDVLIRGGRVIDGTGAAARVADVGITGNRITFLGDARVSGVSAARTIDATGLVVTPGFIDPHTHTAADLASPQRARRHNAAYLMQGVTTVVTGNDGGGPVDVGAALARYGADSIGTNAALFVGFGTLRGRVLGASSSAASPSQLDAMRRMVARAMDGGALGLSTGLYYAPQSYASTEEVIAVAREAASRGGVYDSHLRDESSYTIGLVGAVAEAIRVGREARMPVHIAHIKALGVDVWGRSDSVIAMIRAARAAGQDVTADQYPYPASGTAVGAALLPRWAEAGGRDSLRKRAADPATRERLLSDMRENLRRRNGAGALLITESSRRDIAGKTLEQIAAARGVEPVIAGLDIILGGDASVASFNMHEDDIVHFMREDFVMTGSDGSDGHPRKYGTYPLKLRTYVLDKHVIPLETFVRRSSADVARAFGIANRGTLTVGAFADVLVFDPTRVRERSTYESPTLLAEGMSYVFVNGAAAVDGGKLTTVLAGRGLWRGVE
ncbi:MAG: amidohydrolase family protein [Gemmatimonadaceae bacterium]|nr:amidohydrolase family protein [Gemmatimonadaceae bacterium]